MPTDASKFTLARLLRLRHQQRQQAEQIVGLILKRKNEKQQEIQHVLQQLHDLDQMYSESQLDAGAILPTQSAKAKSLEHALRVIYSQLAQIEQEYAEARQQLLRRHSEWKSLDQLREQHTRQQLLREQRNYQVAMDDFVLSRRAVAQQAQQIAEQRTKAKQ